MLTLSTENKATLIALAKQHCQSYLELHQELRASYSELPNDDYSVGTGVEIDDGSAEDRLDMHFKLAANQVRKFIEPMSSLKAPEKNTLYSFTKKYIYDFCVEPNQEKMVQMDSQLPLALDLISPPKRLVPASTPIPNIISNSMFQPTKKQKQEQKQEQEQETSQKIQSSVP